MKNGNITPPIYKIKWNLVLITFVIMGLIGLTLFALAQSDSAGFLRIFGLGLLISGASTAIGAFLGFLFGIPRIGDRTSTTNPAASGGKSRYSVNTNLEEISDWLTKILVGVGLTQLSSIPVGLENFREFYNNQFRV